MTNLRYVESRVLVVVEGGWQVYTMSLCTSHGVLVCLYYEEPRITRTCQRDTVLHLSFSLMTNLRYVEGRALVVVGVGGGWLFYTMSLCTSYGVLELLHYEGTRIPITCQRDTVLHLICDDQLEVC